MQGLPLRMAVKYVLWASLAGAHPALGTLTESPYVHPMLIVSC